MAEVTQTKQQLEKRRDEINAQLENVNQDLRLELDRDSEEQAIQVEPQEVATTIERNLRAELNMIEEKLLDF